MNVTGSPGESGPDPLPHGASPLRTLFRDTEFFSKLDDAALAQLEQKMRRLHYDDGAIICEEGDPGQWTFVVLRGEVAVIKKAVDGAFIQVTVLGAGDWGGMMSLFEDAPRSARLQARGAVELWALYHDDLERLLAAVPALATELLGFMSRRLRMDSVHLAATLRHINLAGYEQVYAESSPQERLILDTINHRVAAAESLDEIMTFLFDSLSQFSPCDRLTLAFIEDDGSRVVNHWTRATYEPLVLPVDHVEDLSRSSLQWVRRSGRPRVIGDLEQYLAAHPDSQSTQMVVAEGLRSSMTCPLVVGGRPVGFLWRSARTTDAYDEHQVRLQTAINDSISQAVEKAYRIEQLEQANRDYAEVLGFVSHELQSPIASMVTDARLLADGYLGELDGAQRDKMQRIIGKGQYLLSLVRDYLNLARVEDPALQAGLKPGVNVIEQIVEPVIEMADAERETRQMQVERCYGNALPTVVCDPGLVRIAVANLYRNAIKYGRRGGVVRVSVELRGDQLRLEVWNQGPGFAPQASGALFRKFSRLDTKERGTGVGLYSARRIVQLHHGRISATSEPGAWAAFEITLPVAGPAPDTTEA